MKQTLPGRWVGCFTRNIVSTDYTTLITTPSWTAWRFCKQYTTQYIKRMSMKRRVRQREVEVTDMDMRPKWLQRTIFLILLVRTQVCIFYTNVFKEEGHTTCYIFMIKVYVCCCRLFLLTGCGLGMWSLPSTYVNLIVFQEIVTNSMLTGFKLHVADSDRVLLQTGQQCNHLFIS